MRLERSSRKFQNKDWQHFLSSTEWKFFSSLTTLNINVWSETLILTTRRQVEINSIYVESLKIMANGCITVYWWTWVTRGGLFFYCFPLNVLHIYSSETSFNDFYNRNQRFVLFPVSVPVKYVPVEFLVNNTFPFPDLVCSRPRARHANGCAHTWALRRTHTSLFPF